MADAPSFRISTRSSAAIGIWFTSTAEPVRPCAATRRPLSSTNVEAEPCPRKLAADKPLVPRCAPEVTSAFDARLSAPLPLVDRNEISCSGLLIPSRVRSSVVMTCNGKALFVGSCLIRDPVTMIAALSSSAVSVAGKDESCANAGAVKQLANNNIAVFEIFIKSPSSFRLAPEPYKLRTLFRPIDQCNCLCALCTKETESEFVLITLK